MRQRLTDWNDFWKRLLAPPDSLMLELGAGGELLVAKLRALLSLAILTMPLVNMAVSKAAPYEIFAGVAGTILVAVMAQVWLLLARRARNYRWLPWATTSYDITLTTAVLAYLAVHSPAAALNSMVVWVFYIVALALTALRNDARLSLFAGLLAMLQFGLLALVVFLLVGFLVFLVTGFWQVWLLLSTFGTAMVLWFASLYLARIKRGRPDAYYTQALHLWLVQRGLAGAKFINHHGWWSLGRSMGFSLESPRHPPEEKFPKP